MERFRAACWGWWHCVGIAVAIALALTRAGVAANPATDFEDIRLGFDRVGFATSEVPAVRQADLTGKVGDGFLLGAALAAWINASAQLKFDLSNPGGVGPAHAALDPQQQDYLKDDCVEEGTAFAALETRRLQSGLPPTALQTGVAPQNADLLAAWYVRQAQPPGACRSLH